MTFRRIFTIGLLVNLAIVDAGKSSVPENRTSDSISSPDPEIGPNFYLILSPPSKILLSLFAAMDPPTDAGKPDQSWATVPRELAGKHIYVVFATCIRASDNARSIHSLIILFSIVQV